MIKTLTIAFLLLPFTVSAQSGKWGFGLVFGPTVEYRLLLSDGNPISNSSKNFRDENEIPKWAFTAGVVFQRKSAKNWNIETGLMYSNRGYKFNFDNLIFEDQIDPSKGFVNPTTEPYDPIRKFHYLSIPLISSVTRDIGAFQYSIGFGTSLGYMFSTNGGTNRKVDISTIAKTGVAYGLNDKDQIGANMFFRIGLLEIDNTPVTTRLWSTGLTVSYIRAI